MEYVTNPYKILVGRPHGRRLHGVVYIVWRTPLKIL